jgi:hypothetical protein
MDIDIHNELETKAGKRRGENTERQVGLFI